jgi:thiamine-monophosphate kinase
MNEFNLIKKYFRPLSLSNTNALMLNDDIFYNKKNGTAISIDTYVHGTHFLHSEPKYFIRKALRASLSDLYCKGINPETYFLSISLNKKLTNHNWLNKVKKILLLEQKKFKVSLGGGDTTYSSKLSLTITVIGQSKKKPVLRDGSKYQDDIYITGNIGDSFLGLSILKKNKDFKKFNKYFKKKYFEPDIPLWLAPYLNKIATSSIDISDGLAQDLQHLCNSSGCGAFINLDFLPLSYKCKILIKNKKVQLKKIFSKGDDYQFLFTSSKKNRSLIEYITKKEKGKISKIGHITKDKNIIFKYKSKKFKLNAKNMGYKHNF